MSKRDRCESTFGPSAGIRCDKRRGHEGSHGALNGPDWIDHEFSADALRHENALLLAQVATLAAERDRAVEHATDEESQKWTAIAERDGAVAEAAALRRERDAARAERTAAEAKTAGTTAAIPEIVAQSVARAVEAEREACAQVAEADRCPVHSPYSLAAAERIAAAIRARSKP